MDWDAQPPSARPTASTPTRNPLFGCSVMIVASLAISEGRRYAPARVRRCADQPFLPPIDAWRQKALSEFPVPYLTQTAAVIQWRTPPAMGVDRRGNARIAR
jgi:hypothetical protein